MPTAKEFAREVEALSLTITGYQEGKSGQRGLCDCIGLVIGAMTRLGHGSYPIHDTNYFRRYQTDGLQVLEKAEQLRIGHILYKATTDQSDLNDRYKPGGRYHTDDPKDYYHIGVVTDTNPLEITHCTSGNGFNGIKRDSNVSGWTHVGEVKGVDYAVSFAESSQEATMSKTGYVASPDGKAVRLRSKPTTKGEYNTIKKVPMGTVLEVLEVGMSDGTEWATVVDPDGARGYMMNNCIKYLEYADETDEDAQKQPSTSTFEESVMERFDRVETLLNAILDALGVQG